MNFILLWVFAFIFAGEKFGVSFTRRNQKSIQWNDGVDMGNRFLYYPERLVWFNKTTLRFSNITPLSSARWVSTIVVDCSNYTNNDTYSIPTKVTIFRFPNVRMYTLFHCNYAVITIWTAIIWHFRLTDLHLIVYVTWCWVFEISV